MGTNIRWSGRAASSTPWPATPTATTTHPVSSAKVAMARSAAATTVGSSAWMITSAS
ncbi:hypothetical protein [Actinocrispum wychmicini]|uniref:hypothetical protein n=1 Tax=Actinocrispum wychmicini TaxID=1213861 RepID=UPI0014054A53|nr:hypothetical protein [Actinocrispum wychmicini]